MKSYQSCIKKTAAGLALSLLVGCGDIQWPHAMGSNEVPPEVLNEPREVITPPPGYDPSTMPWQRLGDVPSRPKDFSPQPVIQQNLQELEDDRAEAQLKQKQVDDLTNSGQMP